MSLYPGARPMPSFSSFTAARPLVLVGAGKMGSALLAGWLAGGLKPRAVVVIDPSPTPDSAAFLAANGIAADAAPPAGVKAGVLVVAVKPQVIAEVLAHARRGSV